MSTSKLVYDSNVKEFIVNGVSYPVVYKPSHSDFRRKEYSVSFPEYKSYAPRLGFIYADTLEELARKAEHFLIEDGIIEPTLRWARRRAELARSFNWLFNELGRAVRRRELWKQYNQEILRVISEDAAKASIPKPDPAEVPPPASPFPAAAVAEVSPAVIPVTPAEPAVSEPQAVLSEKETLDAEADRLDRIMVRVDSLARWLSIPFTGLFEAISDAESRIAGGHYSEKLAIAFAEGFLAWTADERKELRRKSAVSGSAGDYLSAYNQVRDLLASVAGDHFPAISKHLALDQKEDRIKRFLVELNRASVVPEIVSVYVTSEMPVSAEAEQETATSNT
jgi:hypothetical protein